MKKYFVAYKFSGEDREVLHERVGVVVEALRDSGIDAYCNLFDQHEYDAANLSAKQIVDKAFAKIDESDGLFALITSNEKSEGMLLEVGYAYAINKPIIVAVQQEVKTYVDQLADQVVRWKGISDLKTKLEKLTV